MITQRGKRAAASAVALLAVVAAASWRFAQRPAMTPGDHQTFRMDSTTGAMVLLIVLLAGLFTVLLNINDHGLRDGAARAAKICARVMACYLAVLALTSLLTPATTVRIGDGYCWDLWCIGVNRVQTAALGDKVLYTAEVRIFSDADRVPARRDKDFLYAVDDRGRRFAVFQRSRLLPALDLAVSPHQTVQTALSFVAPASAKKLYLAGDHRAMPWVYLYFGSDVNPFRRPTLLQVL